MLEQSAALDYFALVTSPAIFMFFFVPFDFYFVFGYISFTNFHLSSPPHPSILLLLLLLHVSF